MRTLKLTVAYDGTRYAGWQAQRRSRTGGKPTIQETLERALRRILREPVRVVGSGRTDAGVHAESQVAHLRTRTTLPVAGLLRGVNALLPADLAVTRIEEVRGSFHARFGASRKRYRYRLFTGPVAPPFIRPYVHHVRAPLNVALMRREAAALRGTHDFKAFARAAAVPRGTTRRTITDIQVRRRGGELQVDVEGNGFLHTMVRTIAGTLIDVGRGRLPPGTVRRMLRTGSRSLAGTVAPAQGLTLRAVTYRDAP
ncbi:MAG: tRNA pseudouridine(38-40) synthase TruA [Candidatus Omnitrophica bacterium]|nr:tRNA pseudouridine(38-40) synthase TruA [Candidatus Omnitrophota bacterium]